MKKIVIAHPGQQHSYHTATAVARTGNLYKYLTTVYIKKGSLTDLVMKNLKGDTRLRANRRKIAALSDEKIKQFWEMGALITILLSKFPKLAKLKDKWNFFVANRFNRRAVKYVCKEDIDALIVYDGISCRCLHTVAKRRPDIIKIMDFSIASRPYMRHVFENDMDKFGHSEFYREDPSLWDEGIAKDIISDVSNADYFLAASEFVKKSLIFMGVDSTKIKTLPYGVDVEMFKPIERKTRTDDSLHLLFVGQINRRKGLHHLLSVVAQLTIPVTLKIAGKYDSANDLYLTYKDYTNIEFLGFVDKSRLKDIYANSDVFVLPSLAEGMSLAGLEAMAFGMPILCSDNTGINDLVVDGENGFVYHTGNLSELNDRILWFQQNREKLDEMGKKSRKIAESHTWEHYYLNLQKILKEILH